MNLDGPALSSTLQQETYTHINDQFIARASPVEESSTFTLLLTHIPLHKSKGVCVDAPYFSYFSPPHHAKITNFEKKESNAIIELENGSNEYGVQEGETVKEREDQEFHNTVDTLETTDVGIVADATTQEAILSARYYETIAEADVERQREVGHYDVDLEGTSLDARESILSVIPETQTQRHDEEDDQKVDAPAEHAEYVTIPPDTEQTLAESQDHELTTTEQVLDKHEIGTQLQPEDDIDTVASISINNINNNHDPPTDTDSTLTSGSASTSTTTSTTASTSTTTPSPQISNKRITYHAILPSGLREQNHLSIDSTRNILEGIFGMSTTGGRKGLILTGHDHEGCDVVHHPRSSAEIAPPDMANNNEAGTNEERYSPAEWSATRTPDFNYSSASPFLREITLRSMMGSYNGNAGLLSLWYDFEQEKWEYGFQTCALGVQHWWWAVHVLDLIVLVVATLGLIAKAFEQSFQMRRLSTASGTRIGTPRIDVGKAGGENVKKTGVS